MEFRQYYCNLEIQAVSGQQWKEMCKELGLKQAGRRDELRMRVVSYLYSQDGKVKVHEIAASGMLIKVLKLLNLPTPGERPPAVVKDPVAESVKTCVCGTVVTSIGLICARCGIVQHKSCMGRAANMNDFVCPLCQMRQMEPFEQVVEVLLAPSVTSSMGLGAVQKQFVYSEETAKRLQEPGKRRMIQIRSIRLDEGVHCVAKRKSTVHVRTGAAYECSQAKGHCAARFCAWKWLQPGNGHAAKGGRRLRLRHLHRRSAVSGRSVPSDVNGLSAVAGRRQVLRPHTHL